MNRKLLRDKILGCFNGKNVGGTLGAPLEGKNGFFDIEYFIQPNIVNNPQPNDDLDLQISSLNAVRRFGRNVNAEILAEYYGIFEYAGLWDDDEYPVLLASFHTGIGG